MNHPRTEEDCHHRRRPLAPTRPGLLYSTDYDADGKLTLALND